MTFQVKQLRPQLAQKSVEITELNSLWMTEVHSLNLGRVSTRCEWAPCINGNENCFGKQEGSASVDIPLWT